MPQEASIYGVQPPFTRRALLPLAYLWLWQAGGTDRKSEGREGGVGAGKVGAFTPFPGLSLHPSNTALFGWLPAVSPQA